MTTRTKEPARKDTPNVTLHETDVSGVDNVDSRLARIEKLTRWLDEAIEIPGTNHKVGWDAIIGLAPGVGDLASAALSAYIVNEARQLGVSKWTLTRMIFNVTLDAVVGIVPLVGDFFDTAFKANRKNVNLLRKHLERKSRSSR